MIINTVDNNTFDANQIDSYKEVERKKQGVRLLWWIIWLLIFPPVLIITAVIHFRKKDRITIITKSENSALTYVLEESEYTKFKKVMWLKEQD